MARGRRHEGGLLAIEYALSRHQAEVRAERKRLREAEEPRPRVMHSIDSLYNSQPPVLERELGDVLTLAEEVMASGDPRAVACAEMTAIRMLQDPSAADIHHPIAASGMALDILVGATDEGLRFAAAESLLKGGGPVSPVMNDSRWAAFEAVLALQDRRWRIKYLDFAFDQTLAEGDLKRAEYWATERATGVVEDRWQTQPLWPTGLRRRDGHVPTGNIRKPYQNVFRWELTLDQLPSLESHQLYNHAVEVAFPAAFVGLDSVADAIAELHRLHQIELRLLDERRLDPIRRTLEDGGRAQDSSTAMAFAVMSLATGVPNALTSVSSDSISLGGDLLYEGPQVGEVEEVLDDALRSSSWAPVIAEEVQEARTHFAKVLGDWRNRLWYAAELGLNPDPWVLPNDTDEIASLK